MLYGRALYTSKTVPLLRLARIGTADNVKLQKSHVFSEISKINGSNFLGIDQFIFPTRAALYNVVYRVCRKV